MKIAGILMVAMALGTVSPLRADPESPDQTKHEKTLARLETDRGLDNERKRQAEVQFSKSTTEMSGHNEQQVRDIAQLKSVEKQVVAGRQQKQSRKVMDPLLQSRRQLKQDIHRGGRQVHNDKTVLSVQKRTMDSDAHYRAIEDRKIEKAEKNIADDRREIAQK